MEQVRRQLRPLANTSRLTRLPEYARLARARFLSMVVAIVLLAVLFLATLLASARPGGWWWSGEESDAPQDIMLCIDQPVTDRSTGEFLTYFADQARTYGTQRIGLTSPNRRVVPMTRDYQYAAGRFGDLATLSRRPSDANADTTASFSPAVSYVDYASSVEDILALCMTGFPSFDSKSSHRRSLIYLGPGQARAPGETRPPLMTSARVSEMARNAGIQINAVTPADQSPGALSSLAKATGGQHFSVAPREPELDGDLDKIINSAPAAGAQGETAAVGWFGDSPTAPLAVAVVASTLLCLSLVVLRR